eukprot:3230656-Rhodomonas_salina.1
MWEASGVSSMMTVLIHCELKKKLRQSQASQKHVHSVCVCVCVPHWLRRILSTSVSPCRINSSIAKPKAFLELRKHTHMRARVSRYLEPHLEAAQRRESQLEVLVPPVSSPQLDNLEVSLQARVRFLLAASASGRKAGQGPASAIGREARKRL